MANRFFRTILPWIVLVHVGLFLAFWLTNDFFYAQTNDYLTDKTGTHLNYILICLLIASGLALWSGARLVLADKDRPHRQVILSTILYSLFALVFIAFFYGSFWLLFRESPSQIPRLRQFIHYYRFILDILSLITAFLLATLWIRRSLHLHPALARSEYLRRTAPMFGLLVLIWALALVFPPGSIYRGELPRKPLLIAHRGASFLAPENTLASAELAASQGVYGLETDLHVSLDGVPFLMHDDTLERTTNVAAVFPGRETQRAEQFSLVEVQQLNAGQWFLQSDPYYTIASGAVTSEMAQSYPRLAVPTLAEELEVVRKNHVILLFDLKQPPEDHPYHQQFFDIVFKQIQAAEIDSQIWFLADSEQAHIIQAAAPQMILVHGTDFEHPPAAVELLSNGYRIINAHFSLAPEWIRAYQKAGLWVNLYTVDEPWQYSRMWLLGVDSITSSNTGALLALQRPVFSLPFSTYLAIWIILGLMATGLMAIVAGRLHRNSTLGAQKYARGQ